MTQNRHARPPSPSGFRPCDIATLLQHAAEAIRRTVVTALLATAIRGLRTVEIAALLEQDA